ncbi:MAG: enoyl-CoA hydratase-related protein, partial [Candidatus Promineifilaceae bacterium]
LVGMGRATELLLFGEPVTAEAALQMGLANRVTPPAEVLPLAQEWAARLAAGPALALGMTKRMLTNEWSMDLDSALEAEAQAQALLLLGEDHRRFYAAFREKSPPK